MSLALWLKLAAPYFAVGLFWCGARNGWLTILAYHLQILFWMWIDRRQAPFAERCAHRGGVWVWGVALGSVLAGPLAHALLPCMVKVPMTAWLRAYHMSPYSLALMIPYFGLLHPLLEQKHWAPLRRVCPAAHGAFAGYHVLVLWTLLAAPWLALCFGVLTGASVLWGLMQRRSGHLGPAVVSHSLADTGIALAAWIQAVHGG